MSLLCVSFRFVVVVHMPLCATTGALVTFRSFSYQQGRVHPCRGAEFDSHGFADH